MAKKDSIGQGIMAPHIWFQGQKVFNFGGGLGLGRCHLSSHPPKFKKGGPQSPAHTAGERQDLPSGVCAMLWGGGASLPSMQTQCRRGFAPSPPATGGSSLTTWCAHRTARGLDPWCANLAWCGGGGAGLPTMAHAARCANAAWHAWEVGRASSPGVCSAAREGWDFVAWPAQRGKRAAALLPMFPAHEGCLAA